MIQEAQGTGGTTDLAARDAIGTIATSATAAKVALVDRTNSADRFRPVGIGHPGLGRVQRRHKFFRRRRTGTTFSNTTYSPTAGWQHYGFRQLQPRLRQRQSEPAQQRQSVQSTDDVRSRATCLQPLRSSAAGPTRLCPSPPNAYADFSRLETPLGSCVASSSRCGRHPEAKSSERSRQTCREATRPADRP